MTKMNIEAAIDGISISTNAGGLYYLEFPYTSSIGKKTEKLSVRVPMKREQPSDNDKKALLEAVTVQGGIGEWVQKEDGSVWLISGE